MEVCGRQIHQQKKSKQTASFCFFELSLLIFVKSCIQVYHCVHLKKIH